MSRACPARGCGKTLEQRAGEIHWQFERRVCCDNECAGSVRADAKYAARVLAAMEDMEPTALAPELVSWHDAARRNPPPGPRSWWR